MLAAALLEARTGGDPAIIQALFRDAMRLMLLMRNSIPRAMYFFEEPEDLCSLVRQFPPQVQREALPWLIEFNATKPSPRRAIEDELRLYETWKGGWQDVYPPRTPKQVLRNLMLTARSKKARSIFAANTQSIVNALCMAPHDYANWHRRYPDLAEAAWYSLPGLDTDNFLLSDFQLKLDAMQLVLAIEVYRQMHGRCPDSLNALSPELLPQVPKDPNTGKPFYYAPAETDYWLSRNAHGADPPELVFPVLVKPPETKTKSPASTTSHWLGGRRNRAVPRTLWDKFLDDIGWHRH